MEIGDEVTFEHFTSGTFQWECSGRQYDILLYFVILWCPNNWFYFLVSLKEDFKLV